MGYKIENYHRDDLRKIAIPGRAVSTLFWVLPIGHWKPHDLEHCWFHFTQGNSACRRYGLLLAKNFDMRSPSDPGAADLSKGGNTHGSASLLDLIPEVGNAEGGGNDKSFGKSSILILSGAYPQPGWGVRIKWDVASMDPGEFEQLIDSVIGACCQASDLEAIQSAADAYHHRQQIITERPEEPANNKAITRMEEACSALEQFIESIPKDAGAEIDKSLNRLKSLIDRIAGSDIPELDVEWSELLGRVKILGRLPTALESMDLFSLAVLEKPTTESAPIHPKEQAALKDIAWLKKQWPDLVTRNLPGFLAGPYQDDLKQRAATITEPLRQTLKERLGDDLSESNIARNLYNKTYATWAAQKKSAELSYRTALRTASDVQWSRGPMFLMELEKTALEAKLITKSIPWDPARMVGWKLHGSDTGVTAHDLLTSANSILGTDVSQVANSPTSPVLNGSIFADYAHYISISAPRFTPWQATKLMLSGLLGLPQIRKLVMNFDSPVDSGATADTLLATLLSDWGWPQPQDEISCSLATCIKTLDNGSLTLTNDLNPTRISFEGFLKDLMRIALAQLGWKDADMEHEISVHCPEYNRSHPYGSWKTELEKISYGGALMLLRAILPLAFPGQMSEEEIQSKCAEWDALRESLNAGSHHPPLPPPKADEISQYAATIHRALETAKAWIFEMPWHLTPSQSFGSDPTIVTGYAWSHSHAEERLIRVMLSTEDTRAKSLVVWNKTLTNPIMADAECV